jgi:hypothetical protein
VPPLVPSWALWPAAVAEADGAVCVWLAWTAPVELEELLPPPTCAVPVDPAVWLSPDVTEAGLPALAVVCPEPAPTFGATAVGDA